MLTYNEVTMIEVEKCALLDKESYVKLFDALAAQGAVDKGDSDIDTLHFLANDWQLKIQKYSKVNAAKIIWRSEGNTGAEAREEIELPIAYADTAIARELISKLAPDVELFADSEQRDTFVINGVTLSVKFSVDLGYYAELQMNVKSKNQVDSALKKIHGVANKLSITLLSPKEEAAFMKQKIKESKG